VKKNIDERDAFWRISTGAIAMLWALRRKSRLARALGLTYGIGALAEGLMRYDPVAAYMARRKNKMQETAMWSYDQGYEQEDSYTEGQEEGEEAEKSGDTVLFRIGNLQLQRVSNSSAGKYDGGS